MSTEAPERPVPTVPSVLADLRSVPLEYLALVSGGVLAEAVERVAPGAAAVPVAAFNSSIG